MDYKSSFKSHQQFKTNTIYIRNLRCYIFILPIQHIMTYIQKYKNFDYLVFVYEASVAQWLACWTAVPKIAGSNPAEAFVFFMSVKKSFSIPSFRMGK